MAYLFLFIFGLIIGSFLNVLIDRLPKGEKITGRSHCDHCRRQLAGRDLIPVLSFFILGGRCRYCHKKLSFYYPLVEIITGTIFVIFSFQFAIFNQFSISQFLNFLASLGIVSCLIVIFFADFKYQIIPDSVQIGLFIFSLIFKFQILNYLTAGFVVALPILFLWLVTRGHGMGFGDVKLAFNIGFLLGIKAGLVALYCGFIIGAIVGLLLMILKKKGLHSKIAFGPFLVIGIIIMVLFKREIFEMIDKIYGI